MHERFWIQEHFYLNVHHKHHVRSGSITALTLSLTVLRPLILFTVLQHPFDPCFNFLFSFWTERTWFSRIILLIFSWSFRLNPFLICLFLFSHSRWRYDTHEHLWSIHVSSPLLQQFEAKLNLHSLVIWSHKSNEYSRCLPKIREVVRNTSNVFCPLVAFFINRWRTYCLENSLYFQLIDITQQLSFVLLGQEVGSVHNSHTDNQVNQVPGR